MTTRPIEQLNVALSAGAVATAAIFFSPHFALSVAIGALLEGLNFRGLSIAARAFFRGALRGGTAWLLLLAARLGWVGVVLFLAIRLGGIDPVGVLVGISVVLPASLIGAWHLRPRIDPEARALDAAELGRDPLAPHDDWGWDAPLYAPDEKPEGSEGV